MRSAFVEEEPGWNRMAVDGKVGAVQDERVGRRIAPASAPKEKSWRVGGDGCDSRGCSNKVASVGEMDRSAFNGKGENHRGARSVR